MPCRIAPRPARSALIAPAADAAFAQTLAVVAQLVERATAAGLALSLEELEAIDLPDPASARIDRAQLRALASIYLAADLEPAGIIASVERLAGLGSTGSLTIGLGGAGPLLEQWWRHRHDRMSADERNAFFAQLFGTSAGPVAANATRNQRFEDRLLELCEALARVDQDGPMQAYGGSIAQARIRTAARALAQNLGDASSGLAAFVASEVITTLKDSFAILGHADLRGAFAARDVWGVVRAIARLTRGDQTDPQTYVRRGKAGMLLLAWLADNLDKVLGGGALVQPGDPVIGAAVDWLEATLTLGEAAGPTTQPVLPVNPGQRAAPDWSALGS